MNLIPNTNTQWDWFTDAVRFLGRDWIEQEYELLLNEDLSRPPHPIALEYADALRALGIGGSALHEAAPTNRPLDLSIHFFNLGRSISQLGSVAVIDYSGTAVTEDLQERFLPRLRNPNEYRKARFELTTAALYSARGIEVNIVAEDTHKRPDLALTVGDETIFIECKRCDRLTGRGQQRDNLYDELAARIADAISENSGVAVLTVEEELSEDCLNQTVEQVQNHDWSGRPHESIEVEVGEFGYHRFDFEVEDTAWIEQTGLTFAERDTWFYEHHVRPILRKWFDIDKELLDFPKTALTAARIEQTDLDATFFIEPFWIGIVDEEEMDRVSPIVNQIDNSYKKFEHGYANIVAIDAPYLNLLSAEEFDELKRRAGGKLNVISRITGLTVSTERILHPFKKGVYFDRPIGYLKNRQPSHTFPEDFDIPGTTFNQLYGDLTEFEDWLADPKLTIDSDE